jgi:hypothetical protein
MAAVFCVFHVLTVALRATRIQIFARPAFNINIYQIINVFPALQIALRAQTAIYAQPA